ncbi:hypothetical protein C0993_000946 [Termitomyces sp. T159_Od127]|nr:hypothetical protein C0993_000946 [Termitomyces sp. T159_Od127]
MPLKLQRYSLESANAHNRATYLERENEVLRKELAVLRANPHPDASPQAHPAVEQVQQLTLSLRRLSDKLSLTEAGLLERTTQLSHATAEASKARINADAAYELAARTRGREEAGKLRELELEHKVRAAEEAVKMSDLVVNEYADLVRSLQANKSHERLVDGLAEGKLGLQRLLKDFNAETARLQKELLEAQGALAVANTQCDSDKKHLENCRVELAQAQFELQQLKLDDNTAAKMVSRYMKFSQKSTDTLSLALSSLKTRHSATTSTLSTQLFSLRSQLQASTTQTETLRRVLDELGGELAKEAFGRRREVALRIRMVNREEKVHGELERWVLKAEEAQGHARTAGGAGEGDGRLERMVGAARKLLEGTFGGEDGEVGRVTVAEAAVRELTMELETEMARRLELEKIVALEKAAVVSDIAAGDDHVEVSEGPEKQHQATPMRDDTFDSPATPVASSAPERPFNTVAAAKSSQMSMSEDSTPITNSSATNDIPQSASEQPLISFLTTDKPDDKHEELPLLPTESQLPSLLTLKPPEMPVKGDTPEAPLLKIVEAESDQKPTHISNFTSKYHIQEYPKDLASASLSISSDIPNGEEEGYCSSSTDLVPSSIPDEISTDAMGAISPSAEVLNDLEVSSPSVVEPAVIITAHEISSIGSAHHQNVVLTDGKAVAEGESSTIQHDEILEVDSILVEEKRTDNTSLNGSASSSYQPNGVNHDPKLEIEQKPPPTPASLQDTSTHIPEQTVKLSETSSVSNVSSSPPSSPLDTAPPMHRLLPDLAKTKHRYDTVQRSLRDCHLALESLSTSLHSTVPGHIPAEVLSTAIQRLTDYTEDARVEVEIRIADEEVVGRGFEMMLSVPGALVPPTPHAHLNSGHEQDQDTTTHLDVERQVEAFVDGTDPSVDKAIRSLSRKLEDIEHDIAVLQRVMHDVDDTDAALLSSPSSSAATTHTNEGGGGGWTSWIRSTATSPIPSPSPSLTSHPLITSSSSLGRVPTFGSGMASPRLHHAPSLNLPGAGKKGLDPLATLGLRVPMPSYIQHQAPAVVLPRSRTSSKMYMLGLGARSVSGSGNGSGFFGGSMSPRKGAAAPQMQERSEDEGREESDVE